MRVDAAGQPAANERGLVEIVYKLTAASKLYKASASNLSPTGDPEDEKPFESDDAPEPGAVAAKAAKAKPAALPKDAIIIYTDGACSRNPGPMGIGAVIVDGEQREEISEFLGTGTNNIAELTAIERALQTIPEEQRSRAVVVHSDSSYSIGLLDKGWKAKANAELVARIRSLTETFGALHFVKVKGHAGVPENERCDELATSAISGR